MSSHSRQLCQQIRPAQIEWRGEIPYSLEFDDIYFSPEDGLAESEYVFIDGCSLTEDWKATTGSFQLLELGFGSGLNFLLCVFHWLRLQAKKSQPNHQWLHYHSIEIRPFHPQDFLRAASHWPSLHPLAQRLAQQLPAPLYGKHRILFHEWQVSLDLIYMPVEQALSELVAEKQQNAQLAGFDHIFLDGFAPAKNPQMWQPLVTDKLARLSKAGTRVASFSVASKIKKALSASGFQLQKRPGFGRKREMLLARWPVAPKNVIDDPAVTKRAKKRLNLKYDTPWFQYHSPVGKRVAIIGGGVAGCSLAAAMCKAGLEVTLYEAGDSIAAQASGAAAGIFHPQLTQDFNIPSQLHWSAYACLLRFLSQLSEQQKQSFTLSRGVIRSFSGKPAHRASELIRLANELSLNQWIKPGKTSEQIIYPDAQALDMAAWCHLLVGSDQAPDLDLRLSTQVEQVCPYNNRWQLQIKKDNVSQTENFDHVVYCQGASGIHLTDHGLDNFFDRYTHLTRGQTTRFASEQLASHIQQVLCDELYLVPEQAAQFLLGSTFEAISPPPSASFLLSENTRSLLSESQLWLTDRLNTFLDTVGIDCRIEQAESLRGSAGYRLHARDRLPLCGPLPNITKIREHFAGLGNRRIEFERNDYYNLPGLWLNCGYGSHGLLMSLLNAQILTAMICRQYFPLRHALVNAQHPARFLISELKQSPAIS